ncbi:hypothetical protein LIER_12070 [Lithospermum erythrorhizon]|uniref:Uncharacterized protein n=1 Tax=Lithospermum erythrorhizon TaxID=34254 RepID=A0AAV3PSB1_LITER
MPRPSQQPPGVTPMIPPIEQCLREDIPEEVQRRVILAREQSSIDRLVHEEQERLDEEASRTDREHRDRESYRTDYLPYTPTYSPLYTKSMLPKYGSA